ncbi:hypothetical protein [Desulfoluna spongiiphila]|uniref:hypothetical protein n=1 Tax=Desulfoluna spongiiphila TaxID=419481 RepID=UPI001256B202|nr:hypothetical protein [Desulfoluna spongiiphila]VVS94485.1 hypothetical protein DBB_40570 [Desulfoluna spongiiphila]
MRLADLCASASPDGNTIRLTWANPDPSGHPGIRIVRRTGTYPRSPDDGVVVFDGPGPGTRPAPDGKLRHSFVDANQNKAPLKGETVYYYSLFPFTGSPPRYTSDPRNRCRALSTSPFGSAEAMYGLLPRIYHRYDTEVPKASAGIPEHLREAGQLRRFLDLPGSVLDQLHSHARASLDLHNRDRIDGSLLPLLARWIGWKPDYRQELDTQRNEVKNAPHLYKTVGLVPTVEATVKRLTNWESRTKEFVHNIFLSNTPEQLMVWAMERHAPGKWREGAGPFSVNAACEGRPVTASLGDGTTWVFTHALKKNRCDIWGKQHTQGEGWSPSVPLTEGDALDRDPSTARQEDTLWLFWSSLDAAKGSWCICHRQFRNGRWSHAEVFMDTRFQRKNPAVVSDSRGGLWLFWQEKHDQGWQTRYNRHDGNAWQLGTPALVPGCPHTPAPLLHPPMACSLPGETGPRIGLFWSERMRPTGLGSKKWRVMYRFKEGADPHDTSDWGAVTCKPCTPPDANETDPAPWVDDSGRLHLFFCSDTTGGWSLRTKRFDEATSRWEGSDELPASPYTERFPCPVAVSGTLTILHRACKPLRHKSAVYKATETRDLRCCGSITTAAGNAAKNARHGSFEDFQTYTCDTGKNGGKDDTTWYSRETLGIYLTPDREDPEHILRNRRLLDGVLHRFLPIQARHVFIIEPAIYAEHVYTYDAPTAETPRVIGEETAASLATMSIETLPGVTDHHADRIPQWHRLRSWSPATPDGGSVKTSPPKENIHIRTWHTGLTGDDEPWNS